RRRAGTTRSGGRGSSTQHAGRHTPAFVLEITAGGTAEERQSPAARAGLCQSSWRIPYLFKPHRLLLKNGPMMGLSPTGPAIFLLHSRMLGSGSSGRAALALASTGSAFLLLSIRTLSSRLLSVLSSSGSTSGMFTRPQFWPENLGAWGMFFEQKRLQLVGENDVRTWAYSATW